MTDTITAFVGVRLEGGLLAPSLLERIGAGSKDLKGSAPADYHLAAAERLGDAASRKWLYLRGVYRAFRDRLDGLPSTDPATTETREHWLLVLFGELGFGRVPHVRGGLPARDNDARDSSYPVSHQWEYRGEHGTSRVPMHLLGWHADLDKRGTQKGRAPQSMLQEFLNVSDAHLWALLSNGRQLRLLRDSSQLVGASYVEFDLESIFDGELYSDFLLLFALLHQSRFEPLPREDGGPSTLADCWLERWRVDANDIGVRARDRLRDGVKQALEELGTGFLEANQHIRDRMASGALTRDDFRHELLRLVYQLIFVLVAEDRGVLHGPETEPEAIDGYDRYFSTARLRRIARRRRGDRYTDLWRTQVVVLDALGTDGGQPELGLPGLGGLFFRPQIDVPNGPARLAPDLLRDAELRNDQLLAAIRCLDEIRDDRGRPQRVDYEHLGAEELGSIYEDLLEYEPQHDPAGPVFWLKELRGNERKTTGTYFTPPDLIEKILDNTLDPLIAEAARRGVPADLLKLKVCDPSCGSGDFLVAAARRIATRYAALTSGDDEPAPGTISAAMYDVVRHCIYGVDISSLAVEITKFSLWLASLRSDRPLVYLDSHIKVGNSLLGVTPKLLAGGIPDGAFRAIEGDDSKMAASLRKQNEKERTLQGDFFSVSEIVRVSTVKLAERARKLAAAPVLTLANIREQAREFQEFEASPELRDRRQVANAWCAAFVWRKHIDAPPAITTEVLRRLDDGQPLAPDVADELETLSQRYQFFHWHLEFLDVFRVEDDEASDHNLDTGWQGGFDCVIGNPPWERVKLQEQEFFASRNPVIADASNAARRKKLINQLADSSNPAERDLFNDFRAEVRRAAGWSQLLRESGRYPLTSHGDINTYAVFAETARTIITPSGRSGQVLPTGIGTDATTARFFGDLVKRSALVAFLEFENEAYLLSEKVHHSFRFCLLCTRGPDQAVDEVQVAFRVRYMGDLADRMLTLSPKELLRVNPNTGTTPLFRYPRDAEITFGIYKNVPILWRDMPKSNPWGISFMRMFDMANDARLFRTEEDLLKDGWRLDGNVFAKDGKRMLPLYEAKMIHHFDHRYGTYSGQTKAQANMGTLPRPAAQERADPSYVTMPRYWVQEFETKNEEKSQERGKDIYDAGVGARLETRLWDRGWLLGWRDICRSSDERTMISAVFPRTAVPDGTLLLFPTAGSPTALEANLSSFVFDYVTRQKSGGTHLKYFTVKQLPVLPPKRFNEPTPWEPGMSLAEWIEWRVLELTYTAWDMEPFARDLGDAKPPFVWNDDRRFKMRAELDAAFFRLYEITRDDVDYVMETFGTVKDRDEKRFGDYRTKHLILDRYDAMAKAAETGQPYRTILNPPPARGGRHPARSER